MMIEEMLKKSETRRQIDKRRFDKLDSDECQICHAYGSDKRNLFIKCFYDMSESVPEMISLWHVYPDNESLKTFWYLRICKACRAHFLEKMREWVNERKEMRLVTKDHDGVPDFEYEEYDDDGDIRNIPYRKDGTVIMISESEWRVKHGYEMDGD